MTATTEYYIYIKTSTDHLCFDFGVADDIVKILEKPTKRSVYAQETKMRPEPHWKLVYYEHGHNVTTAMARRNTLQRLPPSKRSALIERNNPGWHDLRDEWGRGR